ncbi:hypothetical protein V4890_23670 [Ralstonia solanacearum species complex bacterium KE056]|uniref:hypothetical protein n=1 Tax=Ralstonia solanacearum species complex bacterium KE056 TaxID=3119585 RepID=UPI002FC3D1EC
MTTMSVKDALAAVLHDLKQMTAEELRRELDANRDGDIATTLREVHAYLLDQFITFHYPLGHIDCLLSHSASVENRELAIRELDDWIAANSDGYALAA